MLRMKLRVIGCIGALLLAVGELTPSATGASVDFETQVKPILAEHCFQCHGETKRKGGLRLSNKRDAFLAAESGESAIQPGKPDESNLIKRLLVTDAKQRMPKETEPLPVEKIGVLTQWVKEGASMPDDPDAGHWAYVKPAKAKLPKVKSWNWPINEIDHFVLAQLEGKGWQPTGPTDRARLIRRVSLALIGLPPSLKEVEDFVADKSADAYEKVVNRLLKSKHYGQRWARPWLDMARYADSNGFQADQLRDSWAYRDWVIEALNADMPFDQFTVEQLAGDLLPNATMEQKIATGFHRTVTCNVEAGVHPEENRVNQVFDRVTTTGLVFLGTTLECAQCHNHKYDPFTMKDYYSMFAYFNNTPLEVEQAGGVRYDFIGPKMDLPLSPADSKRRAAMQKNYDELAKRRDALAKQAGDGRKQWEARLIAGLKNPARWKSVTIESITSNGGEDFKTLKDGSVLAGGSLPGTSVYEVECRVNLAEPIGGIRIEALAHEDLPGKGPGRGDAKRPNFILSELTAARVSAKRSETLTLHSAEADYSQKNWEVAKAIDGNRKTGWAIGQQFGKDHWATFALREPRTFQANDRLNLTLDQNFGRGRTIGRLRISVLAGDPTTAKVPANIAGILMKEKRSRKESRELDKYYADSSPELTRLRVDMGQLKKKIDQLQPPSTLVMVEMEKPRTTRIMRRGNYLTPGPEVGPATPVALHAKDKKLPKNRLGFARWLASPDNPLIGRVTVNRWWAEIFGQGIVTTMEDFGNQCEPPTHPQLLDWLAAEFVESGWSMKHMHKLMVMSAAFRQSSAMTPEMWERDPANQFLARGPRYRLTAEAIRDSALRISGLLSERMGGPPVMPYQPAGIWRQVGRNEPKWVAAKDERRFRRGIYIVYRRAAPYPSFVNFDAPDRGSCIIKRPRTNTPLQALTLLNDPAYLEMALALGSRIMRDSGSDQVGEMARYGFRLCLAREPRADELKNLVDVYRTELARLKKDPKSAEELLKCVPGYRVPKNLDPVETVAWFFVANVLLNLDETITLG